MNNCSSSTSSSWISGSNRPGVCSFSHVNWRVFAFQLIWGLCFFSQLYLKKMRWVLRFDMAMVICSEWSLILISTIVNSLMDPVLFIDLSTLYTGIGTGNLYVFSPFSLANLSSIVVPVHPESNRVMTSRVSPNGVSKVALISNALSDCLLCCMNLGFCWSLYNTNWALSLLISLSCWINLGVTYFWHNLCTKDLMCLMACSSSLGSTTFLIYWNVHRSTVFIHLCLVCLSPFSGRIAIARGLDDSADFFWLGHLSTLSERITWGDPVAFARCSL